MSQVKIELVDEGTARTVAALERASDALDDIAASTDRTRRSMDKAKAATDDLDRRLGKLRQGAGAVFGGIVNDVDDVVGAVGALGPVADVAAVGLAGAAAAAAGLVAGGALATWLYEAADATGALDEENRALTNALDGLQQQVGRKVAPVFEEFTVVAVAGVLAISDFADEAFGVVDRLGKMYDEGGPLIRGIDAANGGWLRAASVMSHLGDETDDSARATGGYIDEARLLVGSLDAANDAQNRSAAGADAHAAATKRAASATNERATALEREIAALQARDPWMEKAVELDNMEAAQDEALTRQILDNMASIDAAQQTQSDNADKATQDAEDLRAAMESTSLNGVRAIGALADSLADLPGVSAAARKALLVTSKASAMLEAGINTALAISEANTLPPPFNIPAMIAAGAAGVAQEIAIAATPTSFHTGGMAYGMAPDEVLVDKAQPGEGWLTRQGVKGAGGAAGVAALNRGEGGGGDRPIVVQYVYQHKHLNDVIGDNIRSRTSPLGMKLRGGRRVGRSGG